MDTSHNGHVAGEQWQPATQLPSFYSPLARAEDESAGDDLDRGAHLPPLPPPAAAAAAPLPPAPPTQPDHDEDAVSAASSTRSSLPLQPPPASLLSPAFTPPSTPGAATPAVSTPGAAPTNQNRYIPRGVPVDSSISEGGCGTRSPRLLERLPNVQCIVRAWFLYSLTQTEMWLHVYKNDVDSKEHFAIVFGNRIRSKSLDAPVPGETEWDRMARGAYFGWLFPGRTSSGMAGSGYAEGGVGDWGVAGTPLVRVHSECYTGETVWSARCDCGEQLDEAARHMSFFVFALGGFFFFLRQEDRNIGLSEKLKAYNLQDLGSDTVEANLLLRHPAVVWCFGFVSVLLLVLVLVVFCLL